MVRNGSRMTLYRPRLAFVVELAGVAADMGVHRLFVAHALVDGVQIGLDLPAPLGILEHVAREQPALGVDQVDLGNVGIALGCHQLAKRHPAIHALDEGAEATFLRVADFDDVVLEEADRGPELRIALAVPGRIGRRKILIHEVVHIFVEQDHLRIEAALRTRGAHADEHQRARIGDVVAGDAAAPSVRHALHRFEILEQEDAEARRLRRLANVVEAPKHVIVAFELGGELVGLGLAAFGVDDEIGRRGFAPFGPRRSRQKQAQKHQELANHEKMPPSLKFRRIAQRRANRKFWRNREPMPGGSIRAFAGVRSDQAGAFLQR
jgi:hypothetical protein